jgi:hypothetical protein
MKNKKNCFLSMLALIAMIILFFGNCSEPGGSVGIYRNSGFISINLNGSIKSARDVMPWPSDDLEILNKIDFVITLTGSGTTQTFNAKSEDNIKATVSSGQWQVKIEAFLQSVITPLTPAGERMHYATGTKSVDVKAGQTSQVTVTMEARFCRGCDYTDPTPATCTESSKTTVICSIDSSHNGETIITQALGHNPGNWSQTVEPTCTEPGVETGICTRDGCNEPNVPRTGEPALGHNPGNWLQTVEPTCTEPGVETGTCTRDGCNEPNVSRIGKPALGHEGVDAVLATCTGEGNTGTGTCTRSGCDQVVTGIVISALGHDHFESLVCKRTDCSHQYAIGESGPAGGIIFYVADGQGGRQSSITVEGFSGTTSGFNTYTAYYLEVALENENPAWWGADGSVIPWVTTFTSTTDMEASLLGNGRRDTQIIVNYIGTSETGKAAQQCVARTAGANDWFLPSLGELNQLYNNKNAVNNNGGNLVEFIDNFPVWLWSSSQSDIDNAWYQNFSSGGMGSTSRNANHHVRAIRAF